MRQRFQISRGDRGIRETMEHIRHLSHTAPCLQWWCDLARHVAPRRTDAFLRDVWVYVPDEQDGVPAETLRTLSRLQNDARTLHHFEGDCDDAAIVAAGMLTLHQPALQAAAIVAVRPPSDPDFTAGHVFCTATDMYGCFRIDPTAPIDADYRHWETMKLSLFENINTF